MAYLIAVDSGHGMETPGKRTPAIPEDWFGKKKGEVIHEKEFNKPAAEYLIAALKRCGFDTISVSPGTDDVPLKDRYTAANNAKADAFISKHYNAATGKWGGANGIETIISQYATSKTQKLADLVQAELVQAHKREDRGVKADIVQAGINIAVLHNTNMPAILTESGFMDNLIEAKTMLDPEFQRADAEATCRGICKYFGVTYRGKTQMPKDNVTRNSPKEDIKWLQEQINKSGIDCPYLPFKINGIYDDGLRIAVLMYWKQKKWNQDGRNTGWIVGPGTREALVK
ncbi:N-acetylmuramoyl-L-alanine amidase [Anaerocolumna sp. AGMB13025]|uniref:N-acetylmuramoyl-L-alanine amidase n=1 Tax=Anaerocolumna sp. AGMB13025 TaxID=3039116 RepID=UPI00241F7211|nr:N-acetylmuramoyl-L-alanine amidase [Anaerocolumna sp. AGMB13025]WFR56372.1 N-acetylmuramoyl-L-alanine amidase [Anaerocolumna sp. AGMB13025]